MTQDHPIIRKPEAEVVEYAHPAEPPKPPNPLLVVHSLLRGRYPLAIGLAIVGLLVGAPLGYVLVKPDYRSTGAVEIRATKPKVMFDTGENISNYGSFLLGQVELIKSRVVDLAMQDPEWKALGRGLLPEQVLEFQESIQVETPRNSELITVSFTDKDPQAAATAVKVVIKTYEQVFFNMEEGNDSNQMSKLETTRRQQAADLKALGERIQAVAGSDDPAALQKVYDYKLKMWLDSLGELNRAQAQVALLGGTPATGPADGLTSPTTQKATTRPVEQLVQEVARQDPWLTDLERERAATDQQIRILSRQYGENHPELAGKRTRLQVLEQDIAARTDSLRQLISDPESKAMQGVTPNAIAPYSAAVADPRVAEEVWRKFAASLRTELDGLTDKKRQVDTLQLEEAGIREVLEATKNRIFQLKVESGTGRLTVLSYGSRPLAPEKDRRKALAALGGLGLAGIGVGCVLLRGFLDRRMRHVDSTRQSLRPTDRLLGVLPHMADEAIDPAKSDAAAFCVHHIRAILQIRQRATGHRLLAVTSPAPADGKTTLVVSLGISLAASGAKTLLVDCDFDGGGLSSRMRRVAKAAAQNGAAGGLPGGLRDALAGASLADTVLPTGYANLSLLPLGMQPGTGSGQLSPATLHGLLARLAAEYDTILIDTGPILGSVEAAIVAAEVDGTILVVSRDSDRGDAAAAVEKLEAAGAEVEGIVFNRAMQADVERSVFRSAMSNRSIRRSIPESLAAGDGSSGSGSNGHVSNGNGSTPG